MRPISGTARISCKRHNLVSLVGTSIMFSSRRAPLSAVMIAAALMVALLVAPPQTTNAFVPVAKQHRAVATRAYLPDPINVFGKKKKEAEDLSFIETRDMTKEEMLDLNAQNEEIMNMELQAMTGFSLILSLPILYLCWVAFFSD